jgi:hypothetical protein
VRIAYPLYLDVPMLTSVLASLEEGLPQSAALESLGIDLEGRVGAGLAATANNAIAQRHTVASLFNTVRTRLSATVKQVGTIKELDQVTEGDFVELSGSILRSPVYEFVTVMERLFALAALPGGQENLESALGTPVPAETRQMFNALRTEFDASPTVTATIQGSVTGIVSLQRHYLRDTSLDELRFGHVRVIGKAVGTVKPGESWSVLSRSLVGHLVSSAFRDAVAGLREINPESDYPMTMAVKGPALFVVPLAVFV